MKTGIGAFCGFWRGWERMGEYVRGCERIGEDVRVWERTVEEGRGVIFFFVLYC